MREEIRREVDMWHQPSNMFHAKIEALPAYDLMYKYPGSQICAPGYPSGQVTVLLIIATPTCGLCQEQFNNCADILEQCGPSKGDDHGTV